jgi:hypothetical protein
MTQLNKEILDEMISDILYHRFREVEKWGIEVSNGNSREGESFIEDQPLVKAMYVIVQIVLEDILPELEIKPNWTDSRRIS